jgi:hypothetical protein
MSTNRRRSIRCGGGRIGGVPDTPTLRDACTIRSVRMDIDTTARARRALRIIALTLTVCWVGFWGLTGLLAAVLISDSSAFVGAFAGIGLAPVVPWIVQLSRRRANRIAQGNATGRRAKSTREEEQRLARLPVTIRGEWRRLEHARDLVHGFAEDGWVEPAALLHVNDHVARLEQLLQADERSNRLGGTPSSTLLKQVEELTALLVALADEAVEHQASLASDDPVPATLADARERLETTTKAYRDLQRPTAPSGVQSAISRGVEQPKATRNLQQPG